MSLDTVRTEPGPWSSHQSQGAVARTARVVIIGGALGRSALDATSAVAPRKPSDYQLSQEWTNAGPQHEAEVTTTPSVESASADLIAELRRVSGLSWQHLARLFGVDRRSIHFWASGRTMSDGNAEHLARVVALLRQLDRGDPARTREWLLAPSAGGELPLDLLTQKRYAEVAAPTHVSPAYKRPPALSTEASAHRLPTKPSQLLQGTAPSKSATGRLLASSPIKTKRSE